MAWDWDRTPVLGPRKPKEQAPCNLTPAQLEAQLAAMGRTLPVLVAREAAGEPRVAEAVRWQRARVKVLEAWRAAVLAPEAVTQ